MDDLITRLTRLDACAVSDALDKLRLTGVVSGLHRLATNRRMVQTVIDEQLAEGLIAEAPTVDSLFAPPTRNT